MADLLSENNSRELCGWIYVGCGSGKECAESRAKDFFMVLCAAMAAVFSINKDKSDSEKISKDLTLHLNSYIGIVSLRGVVRIGARGEFLQHETYCFGSRFVGGDSLEEVMAIVKGSIKNRRSIVPDPSSSPPSPMHNPIPSDIKRSGDVIAISDDEGDSPSKPHPHVHTGDENTAQHACDEGHSPRYSSAEDEVPSSSSTQTHSGVGHSSSTELLTATKLQQSSERTDDDEADKETDSVDRTLNPKGVSHTLALVSPSFTVDYEDIPVSFAASAESVDPCSGTDTSFNARSTKAVDNLKGLQEALNSTKPSKSAASAKTSRPEEGSPLVSLAEVEAKKRKPARSGGDIRSHFAVGSVCREFADHSARAVADQHNELALEIKPGRGAEVNTWHVQQPPGFSRLDGFAQVDMACLKTNGDIKLAEWRWDKEDMCSMWRWKRKTFEKEYLEHSKLWKRWQTNVSYELRCGERHGDAAGSAERREPDPSAQDLEFLDMLSKPLWEDTADEKSPVVVDRSVLAAIVDLAFGDTAHESIGVLFGSINKVTKVVTVTDCRGLKRKVSTLDAHSVEAPDMSIFFDMLSDKETNIIVGWFHTHLHHQLLPSKADVLLQQEFQSNLPSRTESVGLICSLGTRDADICMQGVQVCSRVSFTLFRSSDSAHATRVKWGVNETPCLSPTAMERCFEGVKNTVEENRELCGDLLEKAQSKLQKRWLTNKWENYLIDLGQGTLPLMVQQLEQGLVNLRIQHAQITTRFAKQTLTGGCGPLPVFSAADHSEQSGECTQRVNYYDEIPENTSSKDLVSTRLSPVEGRDKANRVSSSRDSASSGTASSSSKSGKQLNDSQEKDASRSKRGQKGQEGQEAKTVTGKTGISTASRSSKDQEKQKIKEVGKEREANKTPIDDDGDEAKMSKMSKRGCAFESKWSKKKNSNSSPENNETGEDAYEPDETKGRSSKRRGRKKNYKEADQSAGSDDDEDEFQPEKAKKRKSKGQGGLSSGKNSRVPRSGSTGKAPTTAPFDLTSDPEEDNAEGSSSKKTRKN